MIRLIATRPFSYATRRLLPGDEFEARDRDARVLIGIHKARLEREPGDVPAPPKAVLDAAKGKAKPRGARKPKA